MDCGAVYVMQHEYAVVERGTLVGTDEATSCVCLCVAEAATGRAWLAHVDAPQQAEQAGRLLDALLPGACRAWLVGGAEELGKELLGRLRAMLGARERVALAACLPGRGCRVRAGEEKSFAVLEAWAEDRGPHAVERASRWLLSREAELQCCFAEGRWQPAPRFAPPDAARAERFRELIGSSDAELLRRFSTTPLLEGPRFVPALRETLQLALRLATDK